MLILRKVLAFVLDLVVLFFAAISLFILITGGGVYHIADLRISARTCSNLLYALATLALIRYLFVRDCPFAGFSGFQFTDLPARVSKISDRLLQILEELTPAKVARMVFLIIAASLAVKILNAWFFYGFFTGDDVEIHEMTFSKLFAWKWQAWDVRNAFYPMTFIYPVQSALLSFGFNNPRILIFSGRVVVALFSCCNILLVFVLARRYFDSFVPGVLSAFFLAASKLHTTLGSSELPRTVSSTFLLLSVILLLSRKNVRKLLAAAIMLGIATSIRYSEGVFIAPVIVFLILRRQYTACLVFVFVFSVVALSVIGVSDLLYWGKPFYSLLNIVDFTLVKGLSSRGYQPFYYYLLFAWDWTNIAFLILLIISIRSIPRELFGFVWIPLLILSFLPHKEARYVLPVIPFWSISLAAGIWGVMKSSRAAPEHKTAPRVLLFFFLLALGTLLEFDGFRFRRSEYAVDMASFVSTQPAVRGVAIEQLWKAGGRLYLRTSQQAKDIYSDRMNDRQYFLHCIRDREIQAIGIKRRTLDRFAYFDLLKRSGYSQVVFSEKQEDEYLLFVRSGFPGRKRRGLDAPAN